MGRRRGLLRPADLAPLLVSASSLPPSPMPLRPALLALLVAAPALAQSDPALAPTADAFRDDLRGVTNVLATAALVHDATGDFPRTPFDLLGSAAARRTALRATPLSSLAVRPEADGVTLTWVPLPQDPYVREDEVVTVRVTRQPDGTYRGDYEVTRREDLDLGGRRSPTTAPPGTSSRAGSGPPASTSRRCASGWRRGRTRRCRARWGRSRCACASTRSASRRRCFIPRASERPVSGVLLTNLAATLLMTGVIWTVQVVHYPLFAGVGADVWPAYEAAHQSRITVVVGPLMVAELATAVWLVLDRPPGVPAWAVVAGAALVGVVWASTAFVQVPLHAALGAAFDADAHRQLVATNWVRTAAWTLRGGLVLWMAAQAGGEG